MSKYLNENKMNVQIRAMTFKILLFSGKCQIYKQNERLFKMFQRFFSAIKKF